MSLLYDNIKSLCKYKGVKISDIEKSSHSEIGTISRYERRGNMDNLPIRIVVTASELLDVPIETLIKKGLMEEIREQETKAKIYGVFRECELSDDVIADLEEQVDIILKYAKKKQADTPQTERSE